MESKISHKKLSKIFGFNKDREGLITRYLNEQKSWGSHIQNTKEYILKAAADKEKGSVVILGSGWWLDLPYHELSKIFKKLIFIDITHPNQIRHKAKKFSNITLLNADISGALIPVYEKIKKDNKFTNDDISFEKYTSDLPEILNADFVVSLNILNQLSFFPKKFLLSEKKVNKDKIEQIVKKIEKHHIESLPLNKSCLITDYLQYEYDNKNKLLQETKRIAAELPENNTRQEWIWDFDLSGNFINNRKVKFKVAALQV